MNKGANLRSSPNGQGQQKGPKLSMEAELSAAEALKRKKYMEKLERQQKDVNLSEDSEDGLSSSSASNGPAKNKQKITHEASKPNNQHKLNDSSNDEDMDALENHVDPKQGDWQLKQNRNTTRKLKQPQQQPQKEKQHSLPAIKIHLSSSQVSKFNNSHTIGREILRCKTIPNPKLIKFASIKNQTLLIATDDTETHGILSQPWRNDAFQDGVNFKEAKNSPIRILIRGVDLGIDFKEQDLLEQLSEQGVFDPVRKTSRSNGPSRIVSAHTPNKESLVLLLKEGVRIGFNCFRVEAANSVVQCYKCQQVGHTASSCTKEQKCLRCAGPHSHKECQTTSFKCSNCEGNHAACSRACSHIKKATKPRQEQNKPQKTYAQATSRESYFPSQPPPPPPPQVNEEALIEKTIQRLLPVLNQLLDEKLSQHKKQIDEDHMDELVKRVVSMLDKKDQELHLSGPSSSKPANTNLNSSQNRAPLGQLNQNTNQSRLSNGSTSQKNNTKQGTSGRTHHA